MTTVDARPGLNLGPSAAGVTIEARRLPGGKGHTPAGDFTYTVVVDPVAAPAASDDRRRAPRQRTRLRSGKIVDSAGNFVADCLVHDLSRRGGRIRLPAVTALPRAIQIYDDQTGLLHRATVLWRHERDAGIAFDPARDDPRGQAIAAALRRKFYAVRD